MKFKKIVVRALSACILMGVVAIKLPATFFAGSDGEHIDQVQSVLSPQNIHEKILFYTEAFADNVIESFSSGLRYLWKDVLVPEITKILRRVVGSLIVAGIFSMGLNSAFDVTMREQMRMLKNFVDTFRNQRECPREQIEVKYAVRN